jgi:quinoprotein glucose dehydrogenase
MDLRGAEARRASRQTRPPASAASSGTVQSSDHRNKLPLYKTIAAAKTSELTPATPGSTWNNSWSRSNADTANTRYSPLSQINRGNVSNLEVAWVYHSKDGKGNIQANPVIVDGVIFAPTVGKDIVAINGESGTEIWRFHPSARAALSSFFDPVKKTFTELPSADPATQGLIPVGFGPAQRGLTYWVGDAEHGPRLFFLANGYLIALDANTGTMVETFADHGEAGLSKGAGKSSFLGAVAPAIYKNVIIAPNQNIVDAFDVVTGAHLWQFNTLQYPVKDQDADNGGNIWGGIAMDTARGIAFIATGDPHPNFVGVDRPGSDPGTCSLIALDALTGRLLWSFQEIAHNLWDLDNPAPPNLVTIAHNGKRVDAVAQVTKFGNTLLLDRVSGKPLFPYRLRRAPVSTVPGERTSPYQPDLELPQPFARQTFTIDDVTNISPESHAFVLNKVQASSFGWFEPPRLDKPMVFYGVHGGAEWPGASFDPSTGWLYVTANELPWIESLSEVASESPDSRRKASPGRGVYQQQCAVCHGQNRQGQGMIPPLVGIDKRLSESEVANILKAGRNSMPPIAISDDDKRDLLNFLFAREIAAPQTEKSRVASGSVSYQASDFNKLLDEKGYPGSKPPWGTLNAIDLNTGKLVWKVPLGEYEELTSQGISKTGTENFGGAMATAGGLVFCAGTRDLKIRAFDSTSGQELWQYKLPYGGYAPPATYEVNGRQYVVIPATGGGKLGGDLGDAYIAFALPKSVESPGRVAVPKPKGLWEHDNLVAWEVVPFDANKRGPEERAEMLEKLGFKRFSYDWRDKDIPTFDAEIDTLNRHGIDLLAWWFPLEADDPRAKAMLEVFRRHDVHPQLWVMQSFSSFPKTPEDWAKLLPPGMTMPKNEEEESKLSESDKAKIQKVGQETFVRLNKASFTKTPEAQRQRVKQEADRINAIVKLAAPYGCKVELYNHNGWFGVMDNEVAIIERLKELGVTDVGIVYNFNHARDALHDDSASFSAIWEKIKPYVVIVNITGIGSEGQDVYPSQGDRDLEMMKAIQNSGWEGPIGLIAEKGGDAEVTLKNYMIGLDWLAHEIQRAGSAGPRPFPIPPESNPH